VTVWDSQKQQLLDSLRDRDAEQPLDSVERQQLDELLDELAQAEWATLRPVLEACELEQQQLRKEIGHIQSENGSIAALADRYAELLARAKAQLTEFVREHRSLRAEYERVTHGSAPP
jgi:hypothetical protein